MIAKRERGARTYVVLDSRLRRYHLFALTRCSACKDSGGGGVQEALARSRADNREDVIEALRHLQIHYQWFRGCLGGGGMESLPRDIVTDGQELGISDPSSNSPFVLPPLTNTLHLTSPRTFYVYL